MGCNTKLSRPGRCGKKYYYARVPHTKKRLGEREYKCHCAMCAQLPIAIPLAPPFTNHPPRVRTLEHAKMVYDFRDKMFLPYQLMHLTAFFFFPFSSSFPLSAAVYRAHSICCFFIFFPSFFPLPSSPSMSGDLKGRGRRGLRKLSRSSGEKYLSQFLRPREQGAWVPERGLCTSSVYRSRG